MTNANTVLRDSLEMLGAVLVSVVFAIIWGLIQVLGHVTVLLDNALASLMLLVSNVINVHLYIMIWLVDEV